MPSQIMPSEPDLRSNRADELARDLRAQGITGMKIWPFDPYAEASLGHDISTADLMALIRGILFALQARSGDRADPEHAIAVLRDGLRATPA